jgi:hypothetical protein
MIASLKLTEWSESDARPTGAPLRLARGLERRVFPRKEVRTQVEGLRLDHTLPALQRPALRLMLNDLSCGGLSALSDTPLAAGEHVSVTVPSTGLAGGWNAYGRVIRCTPSGMGYRVAVEFDPLPAA